MYFAIGVEPTKLTAAISLWVSSASTASLSPWITVKTPSGRPASFHICARKSEAEGSFSLGFRMKALPQAMALAHIHRGTITGKLNGVMPATTPRGCRIEYTSTPVEACSENPPLSSCGTPAANSTFSSPRAISPAASDRTLPCSAVTMAASSSVRSRRSSRNANRTPDRLDRDASRQSFAAATAAATAALTSAVEARSTAPVCSPVAGLYAGEVRPEAPRVSRPPIQCPMCVVRSSTLRCVAYCDNDLLCCYKQGSTSDGCPRGDVGGVRQSLGEPVVPGRDQAHCDPHETTGLRKYGEGLSGCHTDPLARQPDQCRRLVLNGNP